MLTTKNISIGIGIIAIIVAAVFYLKSSEVTNAPTITDTKSGALESNTMKTDENPVVIIKTNLGDIEVELYPDKAPKTVENFLSYAESGFYRGTIFHRVIDGFMIQGGGFTKEGVQKPTNPPIVLESDNGLKNKRGTIAMARTNIPDSATSQFFINVVDNEFLDYAPGNPGYAVFGKVVSGMDVVDRIKSVKTGVRNGMSDWPMEDIVIEDVVVK